MSSKNGTRILNKKVRERRMITIWVKLKQSRRIIFHSQREIC